MNNAKKLEILGDSARYDRCNYINSSVESFLRGKIPGVYNASTRMVARYLY